MLAPIAGKRRDGKSSFRTLTRYLTEGRDPAPMAVTPEDVADVIVASLRRGRGTVYAPAQLRYVMSAVKLLPRPVFRKLRM